MLREILSLSSLAGHTEKRCETNTTCVANSELFAQSILTVVQSLLLPPNLHPFLICPTCSAYMMSDSASVCERERERSAGPRKENRKTHLNDQVAVAISPAHSHPSLRMSITACPLGLILGNTA